MASRAPAPQPALPKRRVTSPRGQFAEWVAPYIDAPGELRLPEIRNLAVEHFINDRDFLRSFLNNEFGPWLYEIAQRRVAQTRGMILFGDRIVSVVEFTRIVRRQAAKFDTWREYTSTGHQRLLDMTQADLFEAATVRESRAASELRIAAFLRAVGSELKPGEVVRERFSTSALARLEAQLQGVAQVIGDDDQILDVNQIDMAEVVDEMVDQDQPQRN